MSLINEKYEKTYCICLKERDDKYEYMCKQFDKYEISAEFYRPVVPGYASQLIDPYTQRYNSPDGRQVRFNQRFPNELGAMQSHYHVIKTALLEGIQSIFIFEDDCAFHKDWDELLPKYMNTIPENADGILLYSFLYQMLPQNVRVKPRWTKGYACWSILAYGMNRRAMERYIAMVDAAPMIADAVTYQMMTNEGFNFYVASPPLVVPSKTLTSNIRGEEKNYEKYRTVFMLGVDDSYYE
jgi:GR25 family glycosyltransferase involved in LPS biosynthesis